MNMKCPLDQSELLMTERQGVEIDYCPKCRGVWLDRGELDKIINQSEQNSFSSPTRDIDNNFSNEREDKRQESNKNRPHGRKHEAKVGP